VHQRQDSLGRYTLPTSSQRNTGKKKSSGPVKSTPITLASRQNLDIWQDLARSQLNDEDSLQYSTIACRIEADLLQHGASFFDQMQSRTGLRTLLTPNHKKPGTHRSRGRKAMFGVEDAGRWSLLDTFQLAEEPVKQSRHWEVLDEEQSERLISIYLQRWGVLFRSLLDREAFSPPWRILLAVLRKMELRGTLRGGRFVAGVGGEQFAFPESVDELRKFKKLKEPSGSSATYCIAATDPLNLLNLILPNRKLARLLNNRVLYKGGVPIATLDSGEVHFLRDVDIDQQWNLQQMLLKRNFPTRLRSYLGSK
jgi:ATP-dependent Lhr-like helicase